MALKGGSTGQNGSTNAVPLLQRDLEGARNAFKSGDAEASALAHSTKSLPGAGHHSTEPHVEGGEFIKSVVFGGLDGILTSFAIVAGAAGAGLGVKAVLAIGISNVLADALAMGVGEYLSSKSERDYVREEHARETWEFENHPSGEISEMVEIFTSRGMAADDAREVTERMAKYPEFFVNLMMTEELGLQAPDDDDNTVLKGGVMFGSFATFGMLPVLGYVITAWVLRNAEDGGSETTMLIVACVVTGITLLGLGAFKAHFAHKRYLRSALETLVLGGACASLSYSVGLALSSISL